VVVRSRWGQNGVKLGCLDTTPVEGRTERGPLVADDHGVAIVAGRKWFSDWRPGHYYFFAWTEVKSYQLTSPVGQAGRPVPVTANRTKLTIHTRRDVYCWELPLSQAQVTARLGRWLGRIPMS
jgi:hypothetical protein